MSVKHGCRKLSQVAAICLIVICCLAGGGAGAQSPPLGPRDDSQFWNETQVVVPITEKVDLWLIGGLRLGRDMSHLTDERAGAAVAFKLHRYLTVAPTYLYVAQQPSEGRKNFEHRLIFNGTVKFPAGRLQVTDRNLVEYRARHGLKNFVMYRNRLQLDYPVRLGKFEFRPFVADELWYDTDLDLWRRNRFSVGMTKQFNRHFAADIFYLRQTDGRSRPGYLHVLGTLFKFHL